MIRCNLLCNGEKGVNRVPTVRQLHRKIRIDLPETD
jgi:hypothetical protein